MVALALAQVALLLPLLAMERRMRATGGPGIIPFELAGSPERARRIIERWGPEGQTAARFSLALDYPFLVAYAWFQLLACSAAREALRHAGLPRLAAAGQVVAPSQVAAGAFDAAENTALLGVLGGRSGRLPGVARACARAKFALIAAGSLYGLLGAAAARWTSRTGRPMSWRARLGL